MSPIRGLVLDFDGLVLDTEWPDYQAWQEVYAGLGHDLPHAEWLGQVGMGADLIRFDPYAHLEALLGEPVEREKIRMVRRARFLELVGREEVLPGVRELIAEARASGLKLAVASSSTSSWVCGHLDRLGLRGEFDCVRCAEDVVRTKPEPDLYVAAVAGLGLASGEVVAFEDSPNGLHAAKAAGLRCVAVPNELTRGLCFEQADLLLPSLAGVSLGYLLGELEGA